MKDEALILFAHGARDPRWAHPFERLVQRVGALEPGLDVSLAFLELMSPRLPERVNELVAKGCNRVRVVPVFLGQGGHVLRDLPLLLDELRTAHPNLSIQVAKAVGEDESVQDAMARYCLSTVLAEDDVQGKADGLN